MPFITIKITYRISNPLINEQKAAALADVRVRQHDFCKWISGLEIFLPISCRRKVTVHGALHPAAWHLAG